MAVLLLAGCDLIRIKDEVPAADAARVPVARVNQAYLYRDELAGIVSPGTSREDSIVRMESFINSWVRKQLLIQEAAKKININEAEIERKILDYRFSLIAYEYQTLYIKQNLDTAISTAEVEQYYKENLDNFILKQNIVRASFIKVPKTAPRTNKIKDLIFSTKDKDKAELKTYCLSFSTAYHLADSTWMVFDELVKNSPLAEIPNKVQFLKSNPYYETSDDAYLYFLKVEAYRISDNISPLEFVNADIRAIILNKRKVALARKLEEDVYNDAVNRREFELFK
ncbi:MAG: peptidyl-prolyl cis-trans isomerase [Cyclobacteriaceae bacterium]|jgi:CRISPR/Cas system-associated exonuclease Cas4 (RecB family)|nr:peptidyl-prolyl cis-trans isomerase [Cyclobacteriaceae bacterium]